MASPIHRSRQRVRNKVSRLLSRLITPDPLCWARVTLQQGRSVSELRAMLEPVAWRCQLMSPGEREAKVDSASGNHGVQLAERYCCASSSDDSVAFHGSHYSYSTSSRWDDSSHPRMPDYGTSVHASSLPTRSLGLGISSGVGGEAGSDQGVRRSPTPPNQPGRPSGGVVLGHPGRGPPGGPPGLPGAPPRGSFFGYLITLPVGTETAMIGYY